MKKIYSLQGLRAAAFICIFLGHCGIGSGGSMGVSVFLIMSGFLMTYNYWNRELSLGLKRNFLFSLGKIGKLYPLHVILLLPMMLLSAGRMVVRGSFCSAEGIQYILRVLVDLLLVQSWIPIRDFYFSFNGVAWYLSVCVLLYFVFPYVHRWMKTMFKLNIAIWTILLVYIIQIIFSYFASTNIGSAVVYNNLWFTYIFPLFRLGDFLIGCCLGYIFLYTISRETVLTKTTLVEMLALAVMIITHLIRLHSNFPECMLESVIYIPASVMVVYTIALNSGLISRILSNKLLIEIGNVSAYTFLIHQVLINVLKSIGLNRYIVIVGAFVFSIALAYWYRFFLNKFSRYIDL